MCVVLYGLVVALCSQGVIAQGKSSDTNINGGLFGKRARSASSLDESASTYPIPLEHMYHEWLTVITPQPLRQQHE